MISNFFTNLFFPRFPFLACEILASGSSLITDLLFSNKKREKTSNIIIDSLLLIRNFKAFRNSSEISKTNISRFRHKMMNNKSKKTSKLRRIWAKKTTTTKKTLKTLMKVRLSPPKHCKLVLLDLRKRRRTFLT